MLRLAEARAESPCFTTADSSALGCEARVACELLAAGPGAIDQQAEGD